MTFSWQKIEVELDTVAVIGNDSSFFADPYFLRTDSKGRIFVADRALNKILVFSQEGVFLYSIGERGPGPGEFRSIHGMGINNNELFIIDRTSHTIESFSSSGEYLETNVINTLINNRANYDFWNNFHFIFFNAYMNGRDKSFLLYVLNKDFDLVGKYLDTFKMKNMPGIISETMVFNSGSHFISGDTLYLATGVYNGLIYKYLISKEGQNKVNLKLLDIALGLVHKKGATKHKASEYSGYYDYKITHSMNRGSHAYILHNHSLGLFQLDNGKIVHFTYIENKEGTKRSLGVEVYDQNMNPIGYAPLKVFRFNPDNWWLINWDSLWKGKNDRFYVIDNKGIPRVIVFTIEIAV